jgi:hypothetical protein
MCRAHQVKACSEVFINLFNMAHWVRIQIRVVTYRLGKISVTNCARLPNCFKVNLLCNFYALLKLFLNSC